MQQTDTGGAMSESVYQRVLAERFADLDPGLRSYFGRPPAGHIGVGAGRYEVAGSRHRWLRPVFAYLAWRRVLFPEYGHDIPFRVVNTTGSDGSLSAERTFDFGSRTRVMRDRMTIVGGALHDRLGRRGGLEVELGLEVVDGGLRMLSRRQWLRAGQLRIRFPGVVRVRLDERSTGARQRVDVLLTAPGLGEVFRYAGEFDYRVAPALKFDTDEFSTSDPSSERSRG
jgi:hypothetical protein